MLVWHTVLTIGRKKPNADVILISGEAKSDWFYRSENTPLYPRFELTDEFRRESQGGTFNVLTFADFLKRLEAPASVVEEVRIQELLSQSDRPKSHWGFAAESAVVRWLAKRGYVPHSRTTFPDFIAAGENGESVGVEVLLVTSKPLWRDKLLNAVGRSGSAPGYAKLMAFFVALRRDHAAKAHSELGGVTFNDGQGGAVRVLVGYLDDKGEFIMIDDR